MEKAEVEEKKVLLFGFEDLRTILAVKSAVERFGAELIPVGRGDYGKTLSTLAGLEETPVPAEEASASGVPISGVIPGRMAILCGLDGQLDEILPALAAAGAGESCLKAVLTRHNRGWSVSRLYMELSREHAAMRANAGT